MQGKKVLLHANHGVIIATETIGEAFDYLYFLERAAEVQLKALSSCKPLKLIDEAVCIETRDKFIKPGVAKEVSRYPHPLWVHSVLYADPCPLMALDHIILGNLQALGAGSLFAHCCKGTQSNCCV